MKSPSVFVLKPGTGHATLFYIGHTSVEATHVAHSVRDTFGCPAWVEDYWTPASTHTQRQRDRFDAWRAVVKAEGTAV